MLKSRRLFLPIIATCLAVANTPHTATAADSSSLQDTSSDSMVSGGKNGMPMLNDMMRHVQDMGTYKFDGKVSALNGKKLSTATGTFFYKPTNQIRVEVKNYGSKSGSILVKRKDGKIVGKGGAKMLGVKMNLEPSSRLLVMPNGLSALECDIASLTDLLKKQLASGGKIVSGSAPVKVDSLSSPVLVLESAVPQQGGMAMAARIFLDPTDKVPIQWDLFDNGKFSSRASFEGYQSGLQLDDSKFSL